MSLAFAAAAMTLSSCGSAGSDEAVSFDTVNVEKTVSVVKEDGAPTCNVHLNLACAKESMGEWAKAVNAAVVSQLFDMEGLTMQQAADSFATSYTRSYQRDFAPLYREDQSDDEKRAWYEYHYNVTSEATTGREGVIVYTAVVDYYEGGAHGINQRLVMNFDRKTGEQIELKDIFVPGFEQTLNSILLKALIEKTGSKDEQELRDKGYLYSMDMFAPANFVLGKDSMTFIYNSYEIAPYAMGMTELELTYDELESILKK